MKTKRRILGITGIRSEYDIMSSVFRAIVNHPELELQLVVTGAHLSRAYGYTMNEIRVDGFNVVDEIESLLNGDEPSCRVKGLAIQLQGLVQTVARIKPDILLVLGDREEAMTTALVGAYMNIPVAHIAGGDRVIGNVDDQIRHAVTKLAHLHFVTNDESKQRIIQLGEERFRIFNFGNPGLDRFHATAALTLSEINERLNIELREDTPFLMMIQHPISTEIESAYEQMRITLESVAELGLPTIISYPNSDAGSQLMIAALKNYENNSNIFSFKNIPRVEFINLLRRTSCLVGNSSMGILEAPTLKIPVVNVGNRQKGRLHAENVQFVKHNKEEIKAAIHRACFDTKYRSEIENCSNPYGDGYTSERIANVLASIDLDKKLINKDITY